MSINRQAARITAWIIAAYVAVMWLIADNFYTAVVLTGLSVVIVFVISAIYVAVSAALKMHGTRTTKKELL